ncbi:Lysosomal alpha-mannosidase [Blattella germanica]|nr:Lysosomal alpha-mannosidase [Blattella germanica]
MCLRSIKMISSQKMLVFVAQLFLVAVPCFSQPTGSSHRSLNKENLCGYQSCHQTVPNKLNVHLIPHSHDDVGWLKTVDEYYYGEDSDIQDACVKKIIDTVTQSLWKNPDRRFIYVETAYFWKWWQLQTEAKQRQVKTLVNEGRLEFAGGAWRVEADLFTSVLFNHYSAPPDFCFDVLCGDPLIIDDKTSPDYNADSRAWEFTRFVKNQAKYYTSNHILVAMGDDFHYQDAERYFENIDKLVRDRSRFWTGFYSSRPTIKYYERLSNNFLQYNRFLFYSKLMGNESGDLSLRSCMYLNISKCEVTENETKFVVTVYNPLSRNISHYVRFPVKPGQYEIKNSQGTQVKFQLVPIPESVLAVPGKGKTDAKLDLVFRAENIPPLGYHSYYVSLINNSSIPVTPSGDLFIGSEETILLTLNDTSGLVRKVISRDVTIPLKQNLLYYKGWASGAYIFEPEPDVPNPKLVSKFATAVVYKGDLVDEIHQTYSNWATQVIRIYKEETHADIEPVSVFTTDLETNAVFYTDSNGRELLKRQRNFRPTWNVTLDKRISGNYYPVTSRIVIRDANNGNEVAILNDRSQGGSSMNNGEIELMVEYAYGKPLVVRGKHYLVVGNANSNNSGPTMAAVERELALKKLLQPWLFFSKTALTFNQWQSSHKMEFVGLTRNLPSNIHILTLEPWKENELLLRLEHIMEKNEDPELSKPVQVNLQDLFNTFTITEIHETNLAGNQWKEDMNRLVWKTGTDRMKSSKPLHKGPIVTLKPMDILTYVIKVQRKTTIPDYTTNEESTNEDLHNFSNSIHFNKKYFNSEVTLIRYLQLKSPTTVLCYKQLRATISKFCETFIVLRN